MTYEIGNDNPERTARLAAEHQLSVMTDNYQRLLIESTLNEAVRESGAQPVLGTPLLAPSAQVATGADGKPRVVIITDAGTMTPAQAVKQLASSEQYGYLFRDAQPSAAPDLSNLDAPTYRANRAKYLPGGRFSNGR